MPFGNRVFGRELGLEEAMRVGTCGSIGALQRKKKSCWLSLPLEETMRRQLSATPRESSPDQVHASTLILHIQSLHLWKQQVSLRKKTRSYFLSHSVPGILLWHLGLRHWVWLMQKLEMRDTGRQMGGSHDLLGILPVFDRGRVPPAK